MDKEKYIVETDNIEFSHKSETVYTYDKNKRKWIGTAIITQTKRAVGAKNWNDPKTVKFSASDRDYANVIAKLNMRVESYMVTVGFDLDNGTVPHREFLQ